MPRKSGSKTIKKVWNCSINVAGNELHNKDYTTLQELANDLGLSYSQAYELAPNGRVKKTTNNFKYKPNINITRIGNIGAIKQETPPSTSDYNFKVDASKIEN